MPSQLRLSRSWKDQHRLNMPPAKIPEGLCQPPAKPQEVYCWQCPVSCCWILLWPPDKLHPSLSLSTMSPKGLHGQRGPPSEQPEGLHHRAGLQSWNPESTEIPLLPVSWSGIGLDSLFFNKGQFFFIQRHLQICIWVRALHSLHIVTKKIIATNKEQHKDLHCSCSFFLILLEIIFML